MSTINNFNDYNQYNTNQDYSSLFSNMQTTNTTSFNLGDYATIKNGSYKKLLRAYYNKQNTDKTSSDSDTKKVSADKKSKMIKDSADNLKKSADALNNKSLWEKKKIKKTDEETKETIETEDYDWDAITKAVQSFVDSYNDVIKEAGDSDKNSVLRSTLIMTGSMSKNQNLLSKVGISIGKDNKLSLDKDKLKESKITDLKSLFTGYNSVANRVSQKASSISGYAAQSGSTYNNSGSYYKSVASAKSDKINEEV